MSAIITYTCWALLAALIIVGLLTGDDDDTPGRDTTRRGQS